MVKKTNKTIVVLFMTILMLITYANSSFANNHRDTEFEFYFAPFISRRSTNESRAKTDSTSVYVKNTGNSRFYVSEI